MLQFVVVAVTLLGIYFQLRLARSANAFAQLDALDQEMRGERLTRRRLQCLKLLRDQGPAADLRSEGHPVAAFWEKTGSLARAGHIESAMLREAIGASCQAWWALLAPSLLRERQADGDPTLWAHFEWLAGQMDRLGQRQGVEPYLTRDVVLADIREQIGALELQLRDLERMRSVIVQPPEPPPAPISPDADVMPAQPA